MKKENFIIPNTFFHVAFFSDCFLVAVMTEIHQKEMTPLFFRLQIKNTMISSLGMGKCCLLAQTSSDINSLFQYISSFVILSYL